MSWATADGKYGAMEATDATGTAGPFGVWKKCIPEGCGPRLPVGTKNIGGITAPGAAPIIAGVCDLLLLLLPFWADLLVDGTWLGFWLGFWVGFGLSVALGGGTVAIRLPSLGVWFCETLAVSNATGSISPEASSSWKVPESGGLEEVLDGAKESGNRPLRCQAR